MVVSNLNALIIYPSQRQILSFLPNYERGNEGHFEWYICKPYKLDSCDACAHQLCTYLI